MAKLIEQGGGPPHPDLAPTDSQRDASCEKTSRVIIGEVSVPLPRSRQGAMFTDEEGRKPHDEILNSTRTCLLAIESVRAGGATIEYLRKTADQTNRINNLGQSACKVYCPIGRSMGYCPIAEKAIQEVNSRLVRVASKGRTLPLRDEDLVLLLDVVDGRPTELADRMYSGFTRLALNPNPISPSDSAAGQLLLYDAEEFFEGFLGSQRERFTGYTKTKNASFQQDRLEL